MSVPQASPGSITALGDKELEILRLLAAGHTVKSIALRLGRSEASINERLRDARRKTGIGSSRELARLLDAQENRDKKIDLSPHGSAADGAVQPPHMGGARSKGTIIMLIALPLAAVGLFFAAANPMQQAEPPETAQTEAARQLPLVGRWSLDITRLPAAGRPRRVTFDFRMSGDEKWIAEVEIVEGDGSVRRGGATAAPDGVPVPLSGNVVMADTVSVRQPAPDTLVLTFVKQGAPLSTRVYTVAKDRKSMTETIVWAGTSEPRMVTTYFNRIG